MTAGRISRYIFIALFFFSLVFLQAMSAFSFRMRLADYYIGKNQDEKAMQVYGKILRKDLVKKRLSAEEFADVNFDLGRLAAKLDFTNLAVEAYARGSARFSGSDYRKYYDRKNLNRDKMLATGLLEAGRLELAAGEFQRLGEIYPDFRDAGKYIDVTLDLRRQKAPAGNENFYFNLGDSYIANGLFKEARAFFTKRILDYGVGAMEVLKYLNGKYSRDADIRAKVWGDNIYAVLEDFETGEPQFKRYLSNAAAKINKHCITKEAAREGKRSELLDIVYSKEGYDYWVKDVKIPLKRTDSRLGLRLFIKSDNRSANEALLFWVVYREQALTGICAPAYARRDLGNGWEEWRIDGLSESAKLLAAKRNWSQDGMVMEKVIVDIHGVSGRFYFDEIELFLAG